MEHCERGNSLAQGAVAPSTQFGAVAASILLTHWHLHSSLASRAAVVPAVIPELQIERDALFRIGLHSPMRNPIAHRTMESFLAVDGLRELQPCQGSGAETFRESFSAQRHLRVDPVCTKSPKPNRANQNQYL